MKIIPDWLWTKIWDGHLVCPDCYHELRVEDSTYREDSIEWFCHNCEAYWDDMKIAYSWYWPFDILWPRFKWNSRRIMSPGKDNP